MKIDRVEPFSRVGMQSYVSGEMEQLKNRSAAVDGEIQSLTKKLAELKETFLVLSGAMQALEHVQNHIKMSEKDDAPSKTPPIPIPSVE